MGEGCRQIDSARFFAPVSVIKLSCRFRYVREPKPDDANMLDSVDAALSERSLPKSINDVKVRNH